MTNPLIQTYKRRVARLTDLLEEQRRLRIHAEEIAVCAIARLRVLDADQVQPKWEAWVQLVNARLTRELGRRPRPDHEWVDVGIMNPGAEERGKR
jgi:hypothetical protein